MQRSLAVLTLTLTAVAACGGAGATPSPSLAPPAILPVIASSELAVGPTRFLFSLTDRQNRLVAAPNVPVHLVFYNVDVAPEVPAFEADATFLWAIEGERGLYAANIVFPSAGRWGTRFNATLPGGRIESVRAEYDVRETTSTPAIGAAAPSADTPTSADVDHNLAALSSDPDPEPRFYEKSIADALAAKEAFVVAFATPAFCRTATCGPTLETVKSVAAGYPDLRFINVEPYVMEVRDGSLHPILNADSQLQPAPWTVAWGLVTEPFIAIVDDTGIVRAKFEGVITPGELVAAIDAL